MPAEIRKTLLHVETTLIEGGKAAPTPLRMIAAMAVIRNPWAGLGFVDDLGPAIRDCAPGLGALLTEMILEASGGGDQVEGYGKSAIVGLNGEVEHASALIHTLQFGNHYRNAVGAKSYLSFCNTRGPANAPLMIPLMDRTMAAERSHYLTIQTSVCGRPRRRRNPGRIGRLDRRPPASSHR